MEPEQELNYSPTRILDDRLAEIKSLDVIRENDHLYVIDEEEFRRLFETEGDPST
jgi:hypothetical protein